MSKKKQKMSIPLKIDQTKIPNFTQVGDYENHMNNIKWGNGVQQPKKGKGSYQRKSKHKKVSYQDEIRNL